MVSVCSCLLSSMRSCGRASLPTRACSWVTKSRTTSGVSPAVRCVATRGCISALNVSNTHAIPFVAWVHFCMHPFAHLQPSAVHDTFHILHAKPWMIRVWQQSGNCDWSMPYGRCAPPLSPSYSLVCLSVCAICQGMVTCELCCHVLAGRARHGLHALSGDGAAEQAPRAH